MKRKIIILVLIVLLSISVFMLFYKDKVPDENTNNLTGNNSFNFVKDTEELVEYAVSQGYVSSIQNIVITPDYQRPVYHVLYGLDANNTKRVLILSVENPDADIKVLGNFIEDDLFSKEEAKEKLKQKGFDIPDFDKHIHLTPYVGYLLVWNISWDQNDDKGSTYYRYKFDLKTGKIVEEYSYSAN